MINKKLKEYEKVNSEGFSFESNNENTSNNEDKSKRITYTKSASEKSE